MPMDSNQHAQPFSSHVPVSSRQALFEGSANRMLKFISYPKSQSTTAVGLTVAKPNVPAGPGFSAAEESKSTPIKIEHDAALTPPLPTNGNSASNKVSPEYSSSPPMLTPPCPSTRPRTGRRSNIPESRRRTFLNINEDLELIKICVRNKHDFHWGNKFNFWDDVGEELSDRIGRDYLNSETRMSNLIKKRKERNPKLTIEHIKLLDEWMEWVKGHRNERFFERRNRERLEAASRRATTTKRPPDTPAQLQNAKVAAKKARERLLELAQDRNDPNFEEIYKARMAELNSDSEYFSDGKGGKWKVEKTAGYYESLAARDNLCRRMTSNKDAKGEKRPRLADSSFSSSDDETTSHDESTSTRRSSLKRSRVMGSSSGAGSTRLNDDTTAITEKYQPFEAFAATRILHEHLHLTHSSLALVLREGNREFDIYQGGRNLTEREHDLRIQTYMIKRFLFAPGSLKIRLELFYLGTEYSRIDIEMNSLQDRNSLMAKLQILCPGYLAVCKESNFMDKLFEDRLAEADSNPTSKFTQQNGSKNQNQNSSSTGSSSSTYGSNNGATNDQQSGTTSSLATSSKSTTEVPTPIIPQPNDNAAKASLAATVAKVPSMVKDILKEYLDNEKEEKASMATRIGQLEAELGAQEARTRAQLKQVEIAIVTYLDGVERRLGDRTNCWGKQHSAQIEELRTLLMTLSQPVHFKAVSMPAQRK